MIETREAKTDDEAWIIEKLNKNSVSLDNFDPNAFLLIVDDETEEKFGFGRTEYVRNVDGTEYIEINNLIITDIGNIDHGKILIRDLVNKISENASRRIFAFPHRDKNMYLDIGFNEIDNYNNLPEVMEDRYDSKRESFGDEVIAVTAKDNKVKYQIQDNDGEIEKPSTVEDDEVEKIREELGISKEPSTKYQT